MLPEESTTAATNMNKTKNFILKNKNFVNKLCTQKVLERKTSITRCQPSTQVNSVRKATLKAPLLSQRSNISI